MCVERLTWLLPLRLEMGGRADPRHGRSSARPNSQDETDLI